MITFLIIIVQFIFYQTFPKKFERITFNQIHEHFHSNNLYYDNQYGFREKHSTKLAALEIIATPINIYLGLSEACNTIDHNILHKLNYSGINGAALDLCTNYLCNRKQYIEVGVLSRKKQR